jgi:uncharacterized membrane protein YvlD (DUF360 family)
VGGLALETLVVGLALGTLVDRLMVACFSILACLSIPCLILVFFLYFCVLNADVLLWLTRRFCVDWNCVEWAVRLLILDSSGSF